MTPPIDGFGPIDSMEDAKRVTAGLLPKEKESLLEALQSENKQEKKEAKETVTKSLEFEEDTFKIDSTGWKVEKRIVYNRGERDVKVNPTGDVIEYDGEQIFITYDAFIREVMKAKNCSKEEVEKKYLMTIDEFLEKMKDKPKGSEAYKKFFNNEVKDHLAGQWILERGGGIFNYKNVSEVWLTHGCNASLGYDKWWVNYDVGDHGFSGRLLKN